MNHTPGPWQIVDGHYPCFREITGPSFKISVCISATDITFEDAMQRESDMALIAAAPDLLQELRNIANADTAEWDDRSEFEAWAKNRARFAIAKAVQP